jgi:hypothetical protein
MAAAHEPLALQQQQQQPPISISPTTRHTAAADANGRGERLRYPVDLAERESAARAIGNNGANNQPQIQANPRCSIASHQDTKFPCVDRVIQRATPSPQRALYMEWLCLNLGTMKTIPADISFRVITKE